MSGTAHGLSAELVERRLSQLAELDALGQALLGARMPPLSRATFERRALAIEGRLSEAAMRALPRSFGARAADPRDVVLWASSAGARHELGWMPDVIVAPGDGTVLDRTPMVLVGVTQQLDERLDAVEAGWKTIVTLRVLGPRARALDALPTLDGWTAGGRVWLATARDQERTTFAGTPPTDRL
jgi:hypothetical protein